MSQIEPLKIEISEDLLKEIYRLAWTKVAELEAVYQVRELKPGKYVQKLPIFGNDADFDLFKGSEDFSPHVMQMNYPEFKVYITTIQLLLEERGYGSELVPITQMRFLKYVETQEQHQGGQ